MKTNLHKLKNDSTAMLPTTVLGEITRCDNSSIDSLAGGADVRGAGHIAGG